MNKTNTNFKAYNNQELTLLKNSNYSNSKIYEKIITLKGNLRSISQKILALCKNEWVR